MPPKNRIAKINFKFLSGFFVILFLLYLAMQNSPLSSKSTSLCTESTSQPFHTSVTYEFGTIVIENQTIYDDILIKSYANVTFINSTIHGNIYLFNFGCLNLAQGSNITGDIVTSDYTTIYLTNSTVGGRIECRDSSVVKLLSCSTPDTFIWKFDSANLTIENSSIALFNEFGSAGQTSIIHSQLNVSLNGVSSSQVFINQSIIPSFIDLKMPFVAITGPSRFNLMTFNVSYSTSARSINLTWQGWDSPIIDGYLNITFQIFVNGQFYADINGSGFFNQYSGFYIINFTSTGTQNISITAIDGNGNNYTTMVSITIIEYPSFPWSIFWIVVAILSSIIVTAIVYLHYQEKRGYHSSLGTIFKKELAENKIKLIIFVAIAAAPGIILFFIFGAITHIVGSISIDNIRGLVSLVFTLFLYYFGLVFSIVFAANAVVRERRSGTLSWFLSKPVRRWEFLWGKILVYFLVIILIMISTSVAFIIGSISFVDPAYYSDILSMGGYIFLIGIVSIIPLTSIVILCSSIFKKYGLAIFVPIMLLIAIPPIVSFLPLVTKNEYPLLLSFTYYFESLGNQWIYNGGGLFGSIGSSYGEMFGITITEISLTPIQIVLILSSITIICLAIATYYLEKTDVA